MLLATDIAARGLDISEVDNVIHYQIPKTSEVFTDFGVGLMFSFLRVMCIEAVELHEHRDVDVQSYLWIRMKCAFMKKYAGI